MLWIGKHLLCGPVFTERGIGGVLVGGVNWCSTCVVLFSTAENDAGSALSHSSITDGFLLLIIKSYLTALLNSDCNSYLGHLYWWNPHPSTKKLEKTLGISVTWHTDSRRVPAKPWALRVLRAYSVLLPLETIDWTWDNIERSCLRITP